MELNQVINSPGLWITSSIMVIVVVSQAVFFLKTAIKEAQTIGIEKGRYVAGMRSSILTAIGPSFSPVIVLLSLLAVVGGPTTWMRLCDVGAARTELAIVALSSDLVGAQPGTKSFGIEAFTYSIWGMALNNLGWLLVVLITTHKMSSVVDGLYSKYNPLWIKLLMSGTIIGLFSYLLCNQVVPKIVTSEYGFCVAALIAAATMLVITKLLKKYQFLQELSLGISMLAGMFITQAVIG